MGTKRKAHTCYANRDGFTGREKFHRDMAKAILIRADKDDVRLDKNPLVLRPGKRGRQSTGAAAPRTSPRKSCGRRISVHPRRGRARVRSSGRQQDVHLLHQAEEV